MTTPLDALVTALHDAVDYNSAAEAAPEAVVWCDATGEFQPLLPALRARMPGLLSFGDYDPALRTGPALWLRAAAARRAPGVDVPEGDPLIIYLPGHGREVLRGAEDCPADLQPLVWFAVAGAFFGQPNQARDWTLKGFLTAKASPVGIEIPDDKATRDALARTANHLFAEPVNVLRGKRWTAAELDSLLVEDLPSEMLRWMDGNLTAEADPARFDAFSALATKQLGFDPKKKSRQDAAARLAKREKGWLKVWAKFAEFSTGFDEVVNLLRAERPEDLMVEGIDAYPSVNARGETDLRVSLRALGGAAQEAARLAVIDLDRTQGWRRHTLWARRGEARLAETLEHLTIVAKARSLPGHDTAEIAAAYATEAWKVDAAALAALNLVRGGEDREAVVAALRATYLPWLESGALALQGLAEAGKLTFARPVPPSTRKGAVLIFVDGLRMDLAHQLADMLRERGATVQQDWRWSGFPTVTATCKPLASPAAHLLAAGSPSDLRPNYEDKPTTKPVLGTAIKAAGWTCTETLTGTDPSWLEGESIDNAGENNDATKFVSLLHDILASVSDFALRHARQGRHVQIVTDHGFLLVPKGLPHAELTPGMAEPSGKARRVALLKEGSSTTYLRLPWTWDSSVFLATARGARAFYNGVEYAHGGVSPQECVLPVLTVTAEGSATQVALSVQWRGLMAKVRAESGAGLMADVRIGSDTSGFSALPKGPRVLDDAGEANLGVDMDHEGQTVCVLIYRADSPSDVAAKLVTKAGG